MKFKRRLLLKKVAVAVSSDITLMMIIPATDYCHFLIGKFYYEFIIFHEKCSKTIFKNLTETLDYCNC